MVYLTHGGIVLLLWITWLVYWGMSAANVKPAVRHESKWSRASYIIPIVIASILISIPPIARGGFLFSRFLPPGINAYWPGVILIAAGLGFTVWARQRLGRNWSGTVQVKQDHQLISDGPYRFVRHPIYTGILVAFLGTAVIVGHWGGILAALIAFGSFWRKITLEERVQNSSVVDGTAVCDSFTYIWTCQRPCVGFLPAKG